MFFFGFSGFFCFFFVFSGFSMFFVFLFFSAERPETKKNEKKNRKTRKNKKKNRKIRKTRKNKKTYSAHTDGARAYKLKISGVIHDNVVHKKKRVIIKGKAKWIKPHYTKIYKHKLPDGKHVVVKAGTQIIDRFWGLLRQSLKHICRKPGSVLLQRKIRSLQWTYWNRGKDLWKATGCMLQVLFSSYCKCTGSALPSTRI